jgi:hypothetical protein
MITTKEKIIVIKRPVYATSDGEEFDLVSDAWIHEEELLAMEGIFLDRNFKPVESANEITSATYIFLPTRNLVDRFRNLMEWGGDTTEGLESPGWYRFESDHHDYWLNLSKVMDTLSEVLREDMS